jgi:hypothetical protein
MEGPEFPFAITSLFSLDVPDVIAFGFGLFSIFVEAENIRLTPEIVANLNSNC